MPKKLSQLVAKGQPSATELQTAAQRAHELAAELAGVARRLELAERRELPGYLAGIEVERVTSAWSAWRFSRQESKAERAEFFDALQSGLAMVRSGTMRPGDAGRWVISFNAYAHRLKRLDAQHRKKATVFCAKGLQLLKRRRQFATGKGPWPLLSEVVFLLWGEKVAPESLAVDFSRWTATP